MPNKKNQSEAINIFIDRLIEEKNFKNIGPEVLEQIKEDLLDRVEDKINATVLEHMPKENLEEFNRLLDSANPADIQQFCQNNISNLDEIIAKELLNFRNIYLNS